MKTDTNITVKRGYIGKYGEVNIRSDPFLFMSNSDKYRYVFIIKKYT